MWYHVRYSNRCMLIFILELVREKPDTDDKENIGKYLYDLHLKMWL